MDRYSTPWGLTDYGAGMSVREERLAANEDFFRRLNERLEEMTPDSSPKLIVICECADMDCAQRLTLQPGEYERVRAVPTDFVVALDHEDPTIEVIVLRTDRFEVVRKRGDAGETAEDLDPRGA